MSKNSIPVNAHNGVVAGENAKVMTEEILKGFVEEATQNRIDAEVDVLLDSVDEDNMTVTEGTQMGNPLSLISSGGQTRGYTLGVASFASAVLSVVLNKKPDHLYCWKAVSR